jgi:hypothetical protein
MDITLEEIMTADATADIAETLAATIDVSIALRSNHALELTAARIVFASSMATSSSPHLTLAPGDRSSACSR